MLTDESSVASVDERMNALKKYIRNHLDEPLTRCEVARVAGFSVPHLHRLFKAHEGESIAAFVRRMRLHRAGCKLRMGAVDIAEVALAAGYHTHAAFGKAFKRQYGYSPAEFRMLGCRQVTYLLRREE